MSHYRSNLRDIRFDLFELLDRSDAFGVRDSLVKDFPEHPADEPTPGGRDVGGRTWSSTRFDIVLAPADA